jgi:hypothetical protein
VGDVDWVVGGLSKSIGKKILMMLPCRRSSISSLELRKRDRGMTRNVYRERESSGYKEQQAGVSLADP